MSDQLRTISGYLDDATFDGLLGGTLKLRSYRGATQVEVIGGAVLDHDGVRRLIHALSTALPRAEHLPPGNALGGADD